MFTVNWNYPQAENEVEALVKIRYNMKAVSAIVKIKNDCTEIEFLEELSKTREITLYKYEVSQSRDNQKILTEVRDLFKNKENLVGEILC